MTTTSVIIADAVDRLTRAADDLVPCPPVRDLLGSTDTDLAYRVQLGLLAPRLSAGARRLGRKVGLTSPAVQRQLGVDQPDSGVLLDDMLVPDGGTVPTRRLLQPRVEAEVAFRLATDLDGEPTPQRVRAAVSGASAAIEIVDSRITGWDITIVDTIADNASGGMFAVADRVVPLTDVAPADVTMTMTVNGKQRSAGTGRDCLGDPLNALLWLARTCAENGDPLRAGEIVLSGALGPMVPVIPGDVAQARISGLGSVSVTFGQAREER